VDTFVRFALFTHHKITLEISTDAKFKSLKLSSQIGGKVVVSKWGDELTSKRYCNL